MHHLCESYLHLLFGPWLYFTAWGYFLSHFTSLRGEGIPVAEAITSSRSNVSSAEFLDRLKSFVPLTNPQRCVPGIARSSQLVCFMWFQQPSPLGRSVRANIGIHTG